MVYWKSCFRNKVHKCWPGVHQSLECNKCCIHTRILCLQLSSSTCRSRWSFHWSRDRCTRTLERFAHNAIKFGYIYIIRIYSWIQPSQTLGFHQTYERWSEYANDALQTNTHRQLDCTSSTTLHHQYANEYYSIVARALSWDKFLRAEVHDRSCTSSPQFTSWL